LLPPVQNAVVLLIFAFTKGKT